MNIELRLKNAPPLEVYGRQQPENAIRMRTGFAILEFRIPPERVFMNNELKDIYTSGTAWKEIPLVTDE